MTQEALKALIEDLRLNHEYCPKEVILQAADELERLAQTEQEPVAWVSEDVCEGQYIDGRLRKIWWECEKGVGTAFYTTPPQRKPLTKEQIAEEFYKFEAAGAWYQFARAIEAAHGIKENT